MTAEQLKACSLKDLGKLAQERGVRGWQAMRKEQLVRLLAGLSKKGKHEPQRQSKREHVRSGKSPNAAARSTPRANGAAAANRRSTTRPAGKPAKLSSTAKTSSANAPVASKSNGKVAAKNGATKNKAVAKNGAAKSAAKNGALKNGAMKNGAMKNGAMKNDAKLAVHKVGLKSAARLQPAKDASAKNGAASKSGKHGAPKASPARSAAELRRSAEVSKRLEEIRQKASQLKNLSTETDDGPRARDRLVVLVRDPYWLQVHWELSRHGVARAEAALGQEWHTARPHLRLLKVDNASEAVVRDIEVHGGVDHWYVDVQDPPQTYRLEVGYKTSTGRYFVLARSNLVTTPKPNASDEIDRNWSDVAENFDKIYAMSGGNSTEGVAGDLQDLFEERLRRPMSNSVLAQMTSNGRNRDFNFELDAELIVYGATKPGAQVTLQGDPVRVRPDGTFTVRFSMPNCRQVIPAVARSADGLQQRTIVLAVERNTKAMEPQSRENNDASFNA